MPDTPNREGPQAREPSKHSIAGGAMEKDRPKRPSHHQLQEARKNTLDRAVTPAVEAVHIPAHLAPPGSPQAKQRHQLHAQLSLGQSCHRQKKSLASMCTRSLWSCPTLCNPVDHGLPGFPVRGVLQARILEHIGHTGYHTLLEYYIS